MTRVGSSGITTEGADFSVDLSVEGGDESAVNNAALYLKEHAARIAQAHAEGKPPEECDGIGVAFNWEGVFDAEGGD